MKRLLSLPIVRLAAAVAVALLAVWRLPDVVDMPANPFGFWGVTILAFAVLAPLLAVAFDNRNKRLAGVSYPLGLLFACFMVLGKAMNGNRALPEGTFPNVLSVMFSIAVFTAVCGAAVLLLYRLMLRRDRGKKKKPSTANGKESPASRLVGNGFFAFGVLLLCWAPVWLAFYPGTFRYDADTQFYTYLDGYMTTHQPLLHTLLLSWVLDLGNEWDSLTLGVALYCGAQLVAMAAILGYACAWLRRRRAPLGLRIALLVLFALLPLYPLWAFSATKDVLFGGFVLLLCLQTVDLWRDGVRWFRSPLRIAAFILTAVLMMLLRNNGVYALCLALPFAVIAAKSRRVRTAVLLVVCVAAYLGANALLMHATDAESGSYVEALSLPLQQAMRAATYGKTTAEDEAMLEELFMYYDGDWRDVYTSMCADNVKWNLDEDTLSADPQSYLALWRRLGAENPRLYLEAFLEQNLPYYYPGAKMQYNIVLGLLPMDMYELEQHSLLPGLKPFYEAYDDTLTLFGLPVTELLADNAWMVWVTLWLFGLAIYRRRQGATIATGFLLALWVTCLLGPIAAMRYMLGFFYATPVLFTLAFARESAETPPQVH